MVIAIAQYFVGYGGPADEQAATTANDGLFYRADIPEELCDFLVARSG